MTQTVMVAPAKHGATTGLACRRLRPCMPPPDLTWPVGSAAGLVFFALALSSVRHETQMKRTVA
jgi:hypothetical protein